MTDPVSFSSTFPPQSVHTTTLTEVPVSLRFDYECHPRSRPSVIGDRLGVHCRPLHASRRSLLRGVYRRGSTRSYVHWSGMKFMTL